MKGSVLKEEFDSNYGKYRNLLSTLMKKSRQAIIDILKQIWIILRTHGKKSKNLFSDYLRDENGSIIFMQSTDNKETANIIFFSTITRLLAQIVWLIKYYFFWKNEISEQLTDLFKLFFMTGVFPSVIKIAKVVPLF